MSAVDRYGRPYDGLVSEELDQRPLSALPSPAARVAAFVSILLGGLAGGLIGYSLVRVQCSGECGAGRGVGALIGAVAAGIGMSVVAVLVLRAVGEWKDFEDKRTAGSGSGSATRRSPSRRPR